MQVRVLGAHNLETHSTHHTCFLVDGTLAIDAGSLVSTLGADEQLALRHLLLTHLHFDHTRDVPTLGLATLNAPTTIDVYSLGVTLASVRRHLMDGEFYPDLTNVLNDTPPPLRFHEIDEHASLGFDGYAVQAVPAQHAVPTVGYIVQSGTECVAYTGDTGGGLLPFMQADLKPTVLFVDVTFPNRLEARARASKHLTPAMLREQVLEARAAGVTLPRLMPVHLSLEHQDEILRELAGIEKELGIDLEPGTEGMVLG